MFQKFQNKIKSVVAITVLSIVAIYLIAIFLLYSGFLRQDYLQKISHINTVLSQSIETHLSSIEETALSFSVPSRDNDFQFRVALDKELRNMISTNAELTNAVFFTDTEIYYYRSIYNTQLSALIQSIQNNAGGKSLTNQWTYITPGDPGDDGLLGLLYIYPITEEKGYLILFPSPSVFTESLKPLQNTFTDNIDSCLRFDDDHFTPILFKEQAHDANLTSNLPFTASDYTRLVSGTFFISIPLTRFGFCLQTAISLRPLHQKQLTMFLVLSGIFLVTATCVVRSISAYSKGLASRMAELVEKMDTFTVENQEDSP